MWKLTIAWTTYYPDKDPDDETKTRINPSIWASEYLVEAETFESAARLLLDTWKAELDFANHDPRIEIFGIKTGPVELLNEEDDLDGTTRQGLDEFLFEMIRDHPNEFQYSEFRI